MMKEVIELVSRDGTVNRLVLLYRKDGQPSKTYIVKTSAHTLRVSEQNGIIDFVDLFGGPILKVGGVIKEADGAKIKSINFHETFGYTITFE